MNNLNARRRTSSGSTVRATTRPAVQPDTATAAAATTASALLYVRASLWIHDDGFSTEDILINESVLAGTKIVEGSLIEIFPLHEGSDVRDFQAAAGTDDDDHVRPREAWPGHELDSTADHDHSIRYLCIAKFAQAEFKARQPNLQVSIKNSIATAFGFRPRSQVGLVSASFDECSASHVEFSFRDAYLSRSDMWRLVGQELAGRTVYTGQKITFLGTIKLTVKAIHVDHRKVITAYFSGHTIPVFRSEAARYVLFIQMSSEMWDFDSEGTGEIMFSRVINGFLPDLFKRWTDLDVRHLVSIVLFGRLEYDRFDLARNKDRRLEPAAASSSGAPNMTARQHQDFYRVVVTDMASAQWTTILDELKKDFRVFLRDISLHVPESADLLGAADPPQATRIAGRPSTALKGNILEAINIACTQFSNDYVDRDLIRTGVSIVVITAGTGVFEVNRDLLNLTSQSLTNNGVGIDVVCLSKMPLHSVPLFKYRATGHDDAALSHLPPDLNPSPRPSGSGPSIFDSSQPRKLSPAVSSFTANSAKYLASFVSAQSRHGLLGWSFGIPQWVDLSYWAADGESIGLHLLDGLSADGEKSLARRKGPFVSRVRMYEIQMMGLMELGMADMSIPYMIETQKPVLASHGRVKHNARRSSASAVAIRSLSHSPSLLRRNRPSADPIHPNPGLLSTHARVLGETFDRMDEYDAGLFHTPAKTRAVSRASKLTASAPPDDAKMDSPPVAKKPPREVDEPRDPAILTNAPTNVPTNPPVRTPFRLQLPVISSTDGAHASPRKTPESAKVNRALNYSLRGLAPPIRAVPSTEVNITNVQAEPSHGNATPSRPAVATSAGSIRSVSMDSLGPQMTADSGNTPRSTMRVEKENKPGDSSVTKPISINTPFRKPQADPMDHSRSPKSAPRLGRDHSGNPSYDSDGGDDGSTSDSSAADDYPRPADGWLGTSAMSSVPKSTLPFVRNVNASNPLKRHPERQSFFGRWQHLYPRKPRAATVKWRSLCTPASVPLTTDDFPSKQDLETEYDLIHYTVHLENTNEMLEIPDSRDTLLREMIALRFSHGYQLVVGPNLFQAVGTGSADKSTFFAPDLVRPDGSFLYMSMGNTIQRLSLQETNHIQVTRYIRKPQDVQPPYPQQIVYHPNIKTILSEAYKIRTIQFKGFSEQYPWEAADNYLADLKKQADADAEKLRFWRARFVLIPVEPPASVWRPAPAEVEENEEEIHIRGIRALTQMWQKARYLPQDERRPTHNRQSVLKGKDRNPLRINWETLNPSEQVATELDRLISAEPGEVQTTQLLPEAEQFDREIFSLNKLALTLQGDKGIEIKTRRWHLRLHYSCFMGEDLTNWLVHNFKDIDTREEAVDFGNDLMKEGLFEHVNSRHNFKDGNYFYSIKPDWRIQRPEARQPWFPGSRRSDKSIPPTPIAEHTTRESLPGRSRSGSNLANSGHATSELGKSLTDKKRRTVTLSKMIRIDVDHRKRSNRPEVVNLHYDRLHNPDNCYHLELSWLNVTSKLVDDAIISWTTQAEKYGLKLVEIPIAEASEIPEHEPFREAYRIKLTIEPPRRSSISTVYFTATSFTPQAPLNSDVHLYHKALLKRFNFVLDIEALSEFPDDIQVEYSWGKLDYRYTQFIHRSGIVLAQITDEGDLLLLANRLYNSRHASTKETTAKLELLKRDLTPNASSSTLLRPPPLSSTQSAPAPSMQASGIIGLNVQSPQTGPFASPLIRPLSTTPHMGTGSHSTTTATTTATPTSSSRDPTMKIPTNGPSILGVSADVLGSAGRRSRPPALVTPEQIKDDLERFCHDQERLEEFFREVTATLPAQQAALREKERSMAATGGARATSSSLLRPITVPETEGGIPEFNLPEAVTVGLKRRGVE